MAISILCVPLLTLELMVFIMVVVTMRWILEIDLKYVTNSIFLNLTKVTYLILCQPLKPVSWQWLTHCPSIQRVCIEINYAFIVPPTSACLLLIWLMPPRNPFSTMKCMFSSVKSSSRCLLCIKAASQLNPGAV